MEIAYEGRRYSIAAPSESDHIALAIQRSGSFYELDLLEYMRRMRPWMHGDTAVDVGANIGNHSLYFGQFLFKHVFSFEANPALFDILSNNLHGRYAMHHLIPMAAGASVGRGSFVAGPSGNSGMGRAVPGAGAIHFTTVDEALRGRNVALMKVDVEGGELDVLRGSEGVLRTHKPHLFIECATPEAFAAIRDHLAPLGYAPLTHWATTPVYHFAHRPTLWLRNYSRLLRARYVAARALGRFTGRRTHTSMV
jgi:FkbM family methyltransferase